MKIRLTVAAFVAVVVLFGNHTASAALTFNITEGAGTVDIEASGTINLAATTGYGGVSSDLPVWVFPQSGITAVGSGSIDSYNVEVIDSAWLSFGPGDYTDSPAGTGDAIYLFASPQLGLPAGYVSGDFISGSSSFAGSYLSLGLTPGTYVTTFTNGSDSDSVTVIVAAVPEPATFGLIVMGGCAVLFRARKRR